MASSEILDVLIIGAGLSGIDAAYHLQSKCPDQKFSILEGRKNIGGTWDLFRYPGIRSDSDVETLGFPFKEWKEKKSIVDGPSIREYISSTAKEFGLDKKIRFGWKVEQATWSTSESMWTVQCSAPENRQVPIKCRFLYACTGYYSYAEAHQPHWPGLEKFGGTFIHPQFWPESFDAKGKKIVIIGSGATAITLLPALSLEAESVVMLQRSPSYIVSRSSVDSLSQWIRTFLPNAIANPLVRTKNILLGMFVYQFARSCPQATRQFILKMAAKELPKTIDVKKDFNPPYKPWDQRLCLASDGDFFKALRSGKASVATDEIDSLTEAGIQLRSGRVLPADIVISATGLKLTQVGGMKLQVDGESIDLGKRFIYKGIMMSDIPNFAIAMGYTNASWTLKCDLTARYICRLLNYMTSRGYQVARPSIGNQSMQARALINLSSNYIKRSENTLPKQGVKRPWRLYQNYFLDWLELEFGRIEDGVMKFSEGMAQAETPHPQGRPRLKLLETHNPS